MSKSLFPGFKHVSSFSPDDSVYESEEEVSYLTLDLGSIEPTLVPNTNEYRLIVRLRWNPGVQDKDFK